MQDKLEDIEGRYNEIKSELSNPSVFNDMERMTKLSKEFKDLGEIVELYQKYKNLLTNIEGAKEIIESEDDLDLKELAREELVELNPKFEALEDELKQKLIPKDPNDSKNVVLEIRAGTGGDEASLFAGNLFRMYQRYCERKNFKFEVTSYHEGTVGGFKEVSISIQGEDCFGTLKYESGVHRVQRVPDTETQGRVHTSAATVAVLPEPEEFDIVLNENDIKKETFCSQGAGGQSVNTTYSAVRLTHIPTGIVVSMQNERSQIKNNDLAMKILKARIYDLEMQKRNSETAELRKNMVSSGDRSAKIRTYNFPQSRITDHRIGLTLYNLDAVLDGGLDDVIEPLRVQDNLSKLQESDTVKS